MSRITPREGRKNIVWRALAMMSAALFVFDAHAQDCGGGDPCGGGDAASQSCACPSTGAGNPIDVLTGNKYVREADFQMPGELSLSFTRHYNSIAPNGGAFGGGWSHSFETVLTRTERNGIASIQIIQADGRRIEFVTIQQSAATTTEYVSAPNGYGVILENTTDIASLRAKIAHASAQTNPWMWVWPDGRRLTFDQRGLLKRIELPSGEYLALSHDEHGRLKRVSDAVGHSADMEYWDRPQDALPQFGDDTLGAQHRLRLLRLSDGRSAEYRYDHNGMLAEVRYRDGTFKRYEYIEAGGGLRLTKRWSRDGKLAARYRYDESGRAISTELGDGLHRLQLEYRSAPDSPSVSETWLTSAQGKTVYRWEMHGGSPRLIEAVGPGCESCPTSNIRYHYDNAGLVNSVEQLLPTGLAAVVEKDTLVRDRFGRLLERRRQVAGASHFIERYRYDSDHPLAKPVRIERPSIAPSEVHAFDISYNERGQPIELTEHGFAPSAGRGLFQSLSRTTRYSYYDKSSGAHLYGKLRLVDGPRAGLGDAVRYEYDGQGRLLRSWREQQIIEAFVYDTSGRPIAYTPSDGVRIELKYDADGRLSGIRRAELDVEIGYDTSDRISVLRDPIGQQFRLEYDAASRLTAIVDGANNRIAIEFDDAGRVVARTLFNPDGSVSQELRTMPAELSNVAQPASFTNDIVSILKLPTLHPFRTKEQSIIESVSATDRRGGVQQIVDDRGLSSDYVHDDFGRLAYVFNPDSGITRYEYDLGDRLIAQHAQGVSPTYYEYDDADRLVRIDAGGDVSSIEYGSNGKPARIRERDSESVFEYDAAGRLLSHTQVIDGQSLRTELEYDELGRVRERRLPGGDTLLYRYNSTLHAKPGVLASIERKGFLGNTVIIDDLNEASDRYDLQTSRFGNGLQFRRQLNRLGRLQSYGTPHVADFSFETDANNRIAGVSGHRQRAFEYDEFGHLGIARDPASGAATTFGYDPSDNLRFAHDGEESLMLRVDASSNRVTSISRRDGEVLNYSYDDAGRTTRIGERRFEYDASGQLTKILQGERPLAEYNYNSFGQRIRKVTYSGDQRKVTYFFYDGSKLIAEADQSGQVTKQYVYLDDRLVAILVDEHIYAVHTDWRGSPVAATDDKQRIVWQASVDEFGRAEVRRAAFELNVRGSQQYFDQESGLHYNTHRYFDPTTARYLTPDPIGQRGGLNLYAFANGDPINFVDRLGLQASPIQDWSEASFTDKLGHTLKLSLPMFTGRFANDVRDAFQAAIDDLPMTVAVFVAWQLISATPIGWIVNGLVAAYAVYSIGSEVLTFIRAIGNWVSQISDATSEQQLCGAAQNLAMLMSQLTLELGEQASPGRIFNTIRNAGGKLSRNVAPEQRNRRQSRTRLDRLNTARCFSPYGRGYEAATDKRGYLDEFGRQVGRQEGALNRMSADEFLAARAAQRTVRGRHPDASYQQQVYREAYRSELRRRIQDGLRNAGFSAEEAASLAADKTASVMDNYAVLHEPDMFAGGFNAPDPCSIGNCSVNSSIGAQWRNIIDELETYAQAAQDAGHGGAHLNLHLRVCNRNGN